MAAPQKNHFHIRWSGHDQLDWESFDTIEEAKSNAAKLVRAGETFTIQECNEACIRCAETRRRRANA